MVSHVHPLNPPGLHWSHGALLEAKRVGKPLRHTTLFLSKTNADPQQTYELLEKQNFEQVRRTGLF